MKVFVTGATGWIGTALCAELVDAGHEVVGLARSEATATALANAGYGVVRGDLANPEVLAQAAADAEGVVHLGFQHELAFSGDFATAAAVDRAAVEAMGAALAGSDRPFVLASGMLGLSEGRPATERDGLVPSPEARLNPASTRSATALLALSLRGIGVRSSVLRYPPTVHGRGDHGFMATFVAIARQQGFSAYVGDGSNRWPAVHIADAARVTRLALEAAPAGSVVHAVGEEGIEFRAIAQAIGDGLGLGTRSIAAEQVMEHFSFLGMFAGLDSPAVATDTKALLGWAPTGPGLLEDLAEGHYLV